jgi:hypothetical protein
MADPSIGLVELCKWRIAIGYVQSHSFASESCNEMAFGSVLWLSVMQDL